MTDLAIQTKRCSICKKEQPLTREYFDWSSKSERFTAQCCTCRRLQNRNSYERHKGKRLAASRRWYEREKDRWKTYSKDRAERVRLSGGEKSIATARRLGSIYFNNVCPVCGKSGRLVADHYVALTQGGDSTLLNLVPLCRPCNSAKGSMQVFDWLQSEIGGKKAVKIIAKYSRYQRWISQIPDVSK